jgi:hypothetical protein
MPQASSDFGFDAVSYKMTGILEPCSNLEGQTRGFCRPSKMELIILKWSVEAMVRLGTVIQAKVERMYSELHATQHQAWMHPRLENLAREGNVCCPWPSAGVAKRWKTILAGSAATKATATV